MRERERSPFAPTRRRLAGMLAASAAMAAPTSQALATPAHDAELIGLGRELAVAWQAENATVASIDGDFSQAAQDTLDTACERTSDIVSRIEDLHATTLAGLKVKLLALAWTRNSEPLDAASLFEKGQATTDQRLIAGILQDIQAAR